MHKCAPHAANDLNAIGFVSQLIACYTNKPKAHIEVKDCTELRMQVSPSFDTELGNLNSLAERWILENEK